MDERVPGRGGRIGDFVIRRSSLLFFLGGILPALCSAQSSQPGTPPAANQQSNSTANGQVSTSSGKAEKTKKVWTNDEVGTLQGTVSVVGTEQAAEEKAKSSGNDAAAATDWRRGKSLRYRAGLAELGKQMEAPDERTSRVKNFKADDGSPSR